MSSAGPSQNGTLDFENTNARKIVWKPEDLATLDGIFERLDVNKDGKLSFEEIRNYSLKFLAQTLGHNPTDQEITDFCKKIDKDGDGWVSKEELKMFMEEIIQTLHPDPNAQLRKAADTMFLFIDKDKNGRIDKQEFMDFLKHCGKPLEQDQVDMLFMVVDADGDKTTLTKEELLRIMQVGLHAKAMKQRQS